MHRANASNAKAIKMGTIMEINEEDDYDVISSDEREDKQTVED